MKTCALTIFDKYGHVLSRQTIEGDIWEVMGKMRKEWSPDEVGANWASYTRMGGMNAIVKEN